jgi:hypothetical protein
VPHPQMKTKKTEFHPASCSLGRISCIDVQLLWIHRNTFEFAQKSPNPFCMLKGHHRAMSLLSITLQMHGCLVSNTNLQQKEVNCVKNDMLFLGGLTSLSAECFFCNASACITDNDYTLQS